LYNLWKNADNKQTAFRQSRDKSEIVSNVVLPTIEKAERMLDPRVEQFLRFLTLEGVSHLDARKNVWGPIRWARVPQEFKPTMELLVKNFLFASGGAPAERILEIVPPVIEQFWPKARGRILEYAKESEELREAKRAAEQWKTNDCQLDWLIHRGNRLARVKTILNRLSLNQLSETDPVLNDYLLECEKFTSLW
jgi:hypothetical protein